jgi:hypothetical protein
MSLKARFFRERGLLKGFSKQVAMNSSPFTKENGIILWGHLGLGDIISNASIIEHLLTQYLTVVIPAKKRNFDFLLTTYGSWKGVLIAKFSDDPKWEILEVLKLRIKFRYPIKIVGHQFLPIDWDQQPISLNEQFQQLAGIPTSNLSSVRFRETCKKIPQIDIPKVQYIFVDDHPGTEREIPKTILTEASERGFKIVRNDMSVPLYRMLDVLDNAEEIHVVASAPLCFALTTAAAARKKVYYRTKGQGPVASAAYPDWIDVDLR